MRAAVAMALVVMFLKAPAVEAQTQSADDAVKLAVACFSDSWNRHDMVAFGQCFASDADFVNVTAHWWKGRSVIQKNHAFLHGTVAVSDTSDVTVPPRSHGIFKTSTLTFNSTAMRVARPDVAIARASWQMTGDTRSPEPRSGVMMLVVVNQSDGWHILAVQNTEVARTVR
jgi:ketosteroid isomerase-like protein